MRFVRDVEETRDRDVGALAEAVEGAFDPPDLVPFALLTLLVLTLLALALLLALVAEPDRYRNRMDIRVGGEFRSTFSKLGSLAVEKRVLTANESFAPPACIGSMQKSISNANAPRNRTGKTNKSNQRECYVRQRCIFSRRYHLLNRIPTIPQNFLLRGDKATTTRRPVYARPHKYQKIRSTNDGEGDGRSGG